MKPSLFIGSSLEGLSIANVVQENLEGSVETTVWDQDVFRLTNNTLESLLDSLTKFDFGLFVFSDDAVRIRKTQYRTVRDNVLFELGLFMGRLGRDYTFFLIPKNNSAFRLPTDLLGITAATYEADRVDGNLRAALASACNRILREIERKSSVERSNYLGGEWIQEARIGSRTENKSKALAKHIGDTFSATFFSGTRKGKQESYILVGKVGPGPYITGNWRDSEESSSYYGTFQFCISANAKNLFGKIPRLQCCEGDYLRRLGMASSRQIGLIGPSYTNSSSYVEDSHI